MYQKSWSPEGVTLGIRVLGESAVPVASVHVGSVGQDEEDEEGGQEEDGAHHGKRQRKA